MLAKTCITDRFLLLGSTLLDFSRKFVCGWDECGFTVSSVMNSKSGERERSVYLSPTNSPVGVCLARTRKETSSTPPVYC